jgi:hypothetical protein
MQMNKRLFTLCVSLALATTALSKDKPKTNLDAVGTPISLTKEMNDALTAYNPKFKTWKATDYQPWIVDTVAKEVDCCSGLSILLIDVNQDKVMDAILDGHDENRSMLLGLVSGKKSYEVHLISENELSEGGPEKRQSVYRSKPSTTGFDCYLSAHERSGNKFYVMCPQNPDPDAVECDPYFDKYEFLNGEFKPVVQTWENTH